MDFELLFSLVGLLAMAGWVGLFVSPWTPKGSDLFAGTIVPVLLATTYLGVLLSSPDESGGFGSFAEVMELFGHPGAVMAGWIHFLAFDLVVGAWAVRVGRREQIPFWAVACCLPVIFMLGPLGFLLFNGVRGVRRIRGRSN